jgi:hypothetical protein
LVIGIPGSTLDYFWLLLVLMFYKYLLAQVLTMLTRSHVGGTDVFDIVDWVYFFWKNLTMP